MQSLKEVGSSTGINTTVVDSVKRKMPPDLRVDRTEISNSTRKISASGAYEVSSCSILRKLHAEDVIGEDGERDVHSKLVEACFSRETSPSSEICADADEMELSTLTKKSNRRKSRNVDIQTAAEIEEFFSAAEKEDQNKFMNKYNFDVVKEVPLAGRYDWVRIKP